MIITFTDDDRDRARRVGRARQQHHVNRGTPDAHGLQASSKEGLRLHLLGAIAELAVAKALGVEDSWVEFTEQYKHLPGDVGGNIQVRSTELPAGRLIVHKTDPDDCPFVLVRLDRLPDAAEIVGWAWGRDCKRPEFWRGDLPRPCFMVPAADLTPGVPADVTTRR
jgi:hypothetical protein